MKVIPERRRDIYGFINIVNLRDCTHKVNAVRSREYNKGPFHAILPHLKIKFTSVSRKHVLIFQWFKTDT
jgi:hypothetical protein